MNCSNIWKCSNTENDFELNGEKVLRISCTSMGKTFAPNYCNFVMAEWESEVFLMWDHGIENFWQFFKSINNHHSSIKLTGTVDELDTRVFFKPTDTHQLLHKKSFHPKHTYSGIIQFPILRFRTICSQTEDFEHACSILLNALKTRG